METERLSNLEQYLGLRLPSSYVQLLQAQDQNSASLEPYIIGDVKEVLLLNLELRMTPGEDIFAGGRWPQSHLCIGSDECGNYYSVDTEDEQCAVQFFDHEADEFHTVHQDLPKFVDFVKITAAMFPSQSSEPAPRFSGISPDEAVVSRASVPRESVLNPISLAEWEALVNADPDLELDEVNRIPCSGLAVWKTREFQWIYGRICVQRPGQVTLEKLNQIAKSLRATVIKGWEFA